MIDLEWERWAERELPRVRMAVAGFDPNCHGCRVQHDTKGKWLGRHTCIEAAGNMFRVTPEMCALADEREKKRRAAVRRLKGKPGRKP